LVETTTHVLGRVKSDYILKRMEHENLRYSTAQ
jgi:hypothetical protein